MCKPASFVITKGPKVFWSKLSDSHNEIQREFGLNADGVRGPNVVNVEVTPKNNNLSLPLNEWHYKVDQDVMPEWYDSAECERATRLALKDWTTQKLSGWNVKEAFNPVNPFKIKPATTPESHIENLKAWASVGDSVWDSVGASVGDSVRDSVRASVGDSVGDSVRASVRASVGDSVRGSAWAYIGGLFPNITVWKYAESLGTDPWRPLLNMWYAGYVPSFDGTTWRLHSGPDAKIVFEWKPEGNAAKET